MFMIAPPNTLCERQLNRENSKVSTFESTDGGSSGWLAHIFMGVPAQIVL